MKCKENPYSTRVCELGTPCCVVQHMELTDPSAVGGHSDAALLKVWTGNPTLRFHLSLEPELPYPYEILVEVGIDSVGTISAAGTTPREALEDVMSLLIGRVF